MPNKCLSTVSHILKLHKKYKPKQNKCKSEQVT